MKIRPKFLVPSLPIFIVLVATLSIQFYSTASADASTPKKTTLNLVTYNVWGLPWPLTVHQKRFPILSRKLIDQTLSENVALISFQETFAKPAKEMAKSIWPLPIQAWGPGSKFPKSSSGLATVSGWKNLATVRKTFSACKGTDCLSRKGALIQQFQIPSSDQAIWVINTHLNSAGPDEVRRKQLKQLFKWMKDAGIQATDAVILMGDFNYIPHSPLHPWLKSTQNLTDAWDEYSLRMIQQGQFPDPGFTFDPYNNPNAARSEKIPQRLDYIYYRSGQVLKISLKNIQIQMKDPAYKDLPLSDHFALLAQLEIDH